MLDHRLAGLGVIDELQPQLGALDDALIGQRPVEPQRSAIDPAQRPPAAHRLAAGTLAAGGFQPGPAELTEAGVGQVHHGLNLASHRRHRIQRHPDVHVSNDQPDPHPPRITRRLDRGDGLRTVLHRRHRTPAAAEVNPWANHAAKSM